MSTARTYTLDDVKGKDVTKIKADVDELTKALHEVSAVVYQEAAKQGTEEGKAEKEKEEKRRRQRVKEITLMWNTM